LEEDHPHHLYQNPDQHHQSQSRLLKEFLSVQTDHQYLDNKLQLQVVEKEQGKGKVEQEDLVQLC
jgi:hypothetical protein